MTAMFNQELTDHYVAAGDDRADLEDRSLAQAAFARDTIRTLFDPDKRFGIDPAVTGSLAELVDAAEEHLGHIANDVRQRSAIASPSTGGDTA